MMITLLIFILIILYCLDIAYKALKLFLIVTFKQLVYFNSVYLHYLKYNLNKLGK